MRNSNLKNILILFTIGIFASSCSSSNDDDSGSFPLPEPSTENIWSLDNNSFIRSNSTQTSTTYTSGEPFTIINADSNFNNNPVFKTCNFVTTFNTSTVGTYIVKSQTTTFQDVSQKTLYIRCFVTNGLGSGAMYESIDSNLPATITNANGNFLISIEQPITLTRILNDGFEQAPQTFTLICNKVR